MPHSRKYFSLLLVLMLSLSSSRCSRAQTPAFDGQKSYDQLVAQCDFGYRHPGSEGHRACLNYLVNTLKEYTPNVVKQPFPFTDPRTGKSHSVANVIASFGQQGDRIMLCAHWDSRPVADYDDDPANYKKPVMGANDGASGVAVLLELARLFKDTPPPVGVDIVLFDAEDSGIQGNSDSWCIGSRYFARNRGAGYLPRFAILLDMVGDKDLSFPIEENSIRYAPDLVETVWTLAEQLGLSAFNRSIGPEMVDDHLELLKVGIPAIDIIDFDYPYWHTVHDTPDKCSAASLQQVGDLMVTLIYEQ